MSELSVQEKINRRDYETKLPYATRKKNPETWAAYQEDKCNLEDQFKQDALKECGIQDHPKAELAWDYAWDDGHAEGLSGVLYYLERFSEVMV